LDSLPDGAIYFADVPKDRRVFEIDVHMVAPECNGKGRRPVEVPSRPARTVADIADDPRYPWGEPYVLGDDSQGPVIYRDKCVKLRQSRDDKPHKIEARLQVRKLYDGTTKYALCD
jgi:hypothetical protein